MGTPSLQHHLDALQDSLAKEIRAFCDQLNVSFRAHLSDMSSSVALDMELLLDENAKLREELAQPKTVLRDTGDANVPAEMEKEDAPWLHINKGNPVCLLGSSGKLEAAMVSDELAVDADLHDAMLERSTKDSIPPAAMATNYQLSSASEFEYQKGQGCRNSQVSGGSTQFVTQLSSGSNISFAIAPKDFQHMKHMRSSRDSRSLMFESCEVQPMGTSRFGVGSVPSTWSTATRSTPLKHRRTVGYIFRRFGERISQMSHRSSARPSSRLSSATEESQAPLSALLERMTNMKSENPDSAIGLLPEWEDMVRGALQYSQVALVGHWDSFHSSRDSYVVERFQWARHPASFERFCWEALSMLTVLSDMLVVPLAAFDIFESPLSLFAFIFWNIDIVFSMVTGYEIRSDIETRLSRTACHYLQTWFAFDLLIVAPEWVWIFWGRDASLTRFGNLAVALRVLKVSRLLRILRLLRAWTGIRARLRHHAVLVVLQFFKLCSIVLFFNHYSACAWYAIGKMQGDDGWVSRYSLQSSPLAYKYLTSLHWAMSQFHSSMDVHAATSIERLFSLACQFVGMVASSLFISSITSLAMRAQKLHQDKFLHKHAVMRYLEDNRISTKLTMQINTFIRRTTDADTNKCNTVELLKIFPSHLRVELAIQVRTPVMQSNFVSKQIVRVLPRGRKEFCVHVIKEVHEKPGRLIFEYKETSRKAFIVWKGQAVYSAKDEKGEEAPVEAQATKTYSRRFSIAVSRMKTLRGNSPESISGLGTHTVEAGTCIAEMNLFTSWHHRGDCILMGSATGFAIDAGDLHNFLIMAENQDFALAHVLAKHAVGYIQWMRLLPPHDLNDLFQYPAVLDM